MSNLTIQRDDTLLTDMSETLRLHGNSETEKHRAALVACDRAACREDAVMLLDVLGLAEMIEAPVERPDASMKCGTPPGAQAHYRAGEELCEVCAAWSAERHRKTRTEPGAKCGTPSGAQMHRNLGERICSRCRGAEHQARMARRPADDPWDREGTRLRQRALRGRKREAVS